MKFQFAAPKKKPSGRNSRNGILALVSYADTERSLRKTSKCLVLSGGMLEKNLTVITHAQGRRLAGLNIQVLHILLQTLTALPNFAALSVFSADVPLFWMTE